MYNTVDLVYEDYKNTVTINILDKSRQTEFIAFRCLFYKILRDVYGYNYRESCKWFGVRGLSRNHATILHGIRQVDSLYLKYEWFRRVYDLYFFDKQNDDERYLSDVSKSKRMADDPLSVLIKSIPQERREEIYELVNLRVKSWEWKNKDKCLVVEGSGTLEGVY